MAGGFWGGVASGVNKYMVNARSEDKEKAMLLLKGLIEGNVTQKAGVQPPNVGQRIMSGLGMTPSPEANIANYNVQPNVQKQLQQENLTYMQGINKQMVGTKTTGQDLIYRDITGKEISPEIAQRDIAKGNTNYSISRRDISKSGIKQEVITKPEDLEKIQVGRKQSEFIVGQAQDALSTIGEVEKGIQHFGLWGQLPSIPGGERYNWEQNVNKLLSGKIVDLITQMKATSKTGATGFGQLSDREGQILREASTALKRGLSPKDAQKYINIMKEKLQKVVTGVSENQTQPQMEIGNKRQVGRFIIEE